MNEIYAILDMLQPTAEQLKELWCECTHVATTGDDESRRYAELFAHQLWVHVQRRIERGVI